MNPRNISDLLSDHLEDLLGTMLLLKHGGPFDGMSGICTAALWHRDIDDKSIVAINSPAHPFPQGFMTFRFTDEELIGFLREITEVVGVDETKTYTLIDDIK